MVSRIDAGLANLSAAPHMATAMANVPLALPQFDSKKEGLPRSSKNFGVTHFYIEMLKSLESICDLIMPSRLTHTHI